jgi:ribosomal subunit interface protein
MICTVIFSSGVLDGIVESNHKYVTQWRECMKLQGVDKEITVQGAHIDLGDALPEHVRSTIVLTASKWFNRITSASVHFRQEGSSYVCTVNVHVGSIPPFIGEHSHKDIYVAFGVAMEKVAKQMRRRKRETREDKATRPDKTAFLNSPIERDRDLPLE